MTNDLTPEEVSEMVARINEAFIPFLDAVISAINGLNAWANENKELFETINAELDRLEKEGEKL